MRKLLLITLALSSFALRVNAQSCTPDGGFTGPGTSPNTIQNLDSAHVDTYFEQVITVVIPTDTNISGLGVVPIDSVTITGVTGLPAGMSYTCQNSRCKTLGGSTGCIKIFGTPTNAAIGTNTLVIKTRIYGIVFTMPVFRDQDLTGYKLKVGTLVSIEEQKQNGFSLLNNMPNPFSGETTIPFVSNKAEKYTFTVYDNTGKQVFQDMINANEGDNKYIFNAGSLKSGLYHYSLKNNKGIVSRTMMVD